VAKKKDDVDLDFEDEDEGADEDEFGEDDADEDDEDFDEEEDEDEDGGKKRSPLVPILLVVLFLGAVGAGAFAFMSGGGSLDMLSSVPVVGQYFAKPTPVPPAIPTGFANPNLETRKPATGSPDGAAGATAAVAAAPAAGAAGAAAGTAAAPPAAKPAAPAPKPAAPAAAAPKPAAPAPKPAAPAAAAPKPAAPKPAPAAVAAQPAPETVGSWETGATAPAAQAQEPVKRVSSHRYGERKAKKQHARKWREAREHRHHTWRAASEVSHGGGRGAYSVQVGAFSQPSNAERLISSLKSQGFPAYGTGGGVHGGQFHVRSNVVDSRQKANQLANQFRLAGWSPRVVPLAGSQYVLHLGTFGTQEQANGLVADLNSKGLFATVSGRVGARAGSSGGPNRVWVGSFGNRAEAEAMASKLRSSIGAAIVVRR
jgi:cell division septation protein DedD